MPVIVIVKVPRGAFLFTWMLIEELPGAATGLGEKLTEVLGGAPDWLSVIDVDPLEVRATVAPPELPRGTVSDVGDTEMPKSGVGALTVTVNVVV